MSVLDDLKMIHERDAQDALGIAEKQLDQYLNDFKFSWTPSRPIYEVIVAGMGGSGLAAKAYKVFGDLYVPFEVIQDYDLPDRVTANTLLICSSYSGNTEETLSVIEQALDLEGPHEAPMIVVVASGGKLLDLARQHNLPYIELPSGYQPRFTLGYQYRALAEIFENTPLKDKGVERLESNVNNVKDAIKNWLPDVPTDQNEAKKLAHELAGSSVVIYSSAAFVSVAYKWKISINENAKNVAWYGVYPEFNHNEFLGWSSHPVDKPYKVVNLISNLDHPQIQKRFDVTEKMLSGKKPSAEVVNLQGESMLQQMIYGTTFGDFVSLYLALLNGLNPSPVDLIEKLKAELA